MERFKLLIIEDNEDILNLYYHFIPDYEFDKQYITNAADAFPLYETWQPDIILLDLFLPGLSGVDFLKKIRREYNDAETIIVVISGDDSAETKDECHAVGIQGYFIKPIKGKEVADKLLDAYWHAAVSRAKELLDTDSPASGPGEENRRLVLSLEKAQERIAALEIENETLRAALAKAQA